MRRFFLLSAVLAGLCAGCVPRPATNGLEAVPQPPDHYQAATVGAEDETGAVPSQVEDRWWTGFGSPALDRAVDTALSYNLDLAAAAARVEQAAAAARIAGAAVYPATTIGVSGSRRRQNFIGFPIPGSASRVLSTSSTNLGVSLNTSWEVDLWGRLRAGAKASAAEFQAAQADLAGARLSIAGQVVKAWLSWTEAAEQVALSQVTTDSYRDSLEIVRNRYAQGLVPSLDLRQMKANLAAAEAQLAARRIQMDAAGRQLMLLMGRYPAAPGDSAGEMPSPPAVLPAGLPADLVSRRPDLAAAESRLTAAGFRHSAARRLLYPRLSLTASGGTSSNELKDLVNGDFQVWSLFAGLTQPIFQRGRLKSGIEQSRAAADEAVARYGSALLRAYGEVETALAAEPNLAEQESRLEEAARQAAAARKLAEERYRSGLAPFVTVLESQRQEIEAKVRWISARRQRLDNRTDLYLALGGGYRAPASPANPQEYRR